MKMWGGVFLFNFFSPVESRLNSLWVIFITWREKNDKRADLNVWIEAERRYHRRHVTWLAGAQLWTFGFSTVTAARCAIIGLPFFISSASYSVELTAKIIITYAVVFSFIYKKQIHIIDRSRSRYVERSHNTKRERVNKILARIVALGLKTIKIF